MHVFGFSEFGTGKDRLVKVVQKEKLTTITGLLGRCMLLPSAVFMFVCLLGAIVLPQWTHKL